VEAVVNGNGRIVPLPVGRPEPQKPLIYFWHGEWWVARNGRGSSVYDRQSRASFREACHLAMLAAIHAGVWRA
jgi:hypothetical protein